MQQQSGYGRPVNGPFRREQQQPETWTQFWTTIMASWRRISKDRATQIRRLNNAEEVEVHINEEAGKQ
jgi:hypothetical protein